MESIQSLLTLKKQEFGIQGYQVAKTPLVITKGVKISPPRSPPFPKLVKMSKVSPDPAKYSPTLEKMHENYWKVSNGKFTTSKRGNFIDDEISRSKSNPGPGAYKQQSEKFGKNSPLGRFDKGERLNFLTTAEYYAEETPASSDYSFPNMKKVKSVRWIKPKPKPKPIRSEVGPGKYSEGVAKGINKTMAAVPKYSFPKSQTYKNLPNKTFTPGVGSYKDPNKAFFSNMVKKVKAAIILPYKLKSFTEVAMKNSKNVPGPGAYNII